MSYENLRLSVADGIGTLTVHRPDKLNALNSATIDELDRAIVGMVSDPEVGGIIVTGSGRAFVAGADIAELAALDTGGAREMSRRGQEVFSRFESSHKPVIAAVNGFALGGGCELAMACHMRIAADTAKFGQPEVKLGLIPGYGGTQRLARMIGAGRALELLLTGDRVSAAEAFRLGLVNRVVPAADLMSEARKLAAAIAAKAPLAVRYILEAVNRGVNLPLGDAQSLEAALFGVVASTDDMREGTRAFLEKRKPAFKGT